MSEERRTVPVSPRRRPAREPRDYERAWKDHFVDKKLKDEWLERLNTLASFNLISICEGHTFSRVLRGDRPHINLRLKEALLSSSFSCFEETVKAYKSRIVDIFESNTLVEVNLAARITNRPQRRPLDLTIHISAPFTVESDGASEATEKWFSDIVPKIEMLDSAVKDR